MRKISWLLATAGAAALVSTAAVQGVAASAKPASAGPQPASVLRFSTMTPVTGPYVGPANPIRGEAGGGLPWLLTSGHGSLNRSGHLVVQVRGLILARQAPVPPALQGTNPFPAFPALVSCQTIGAGNLGCHSALPRRPANCVGEISGGQGGGADRPAAPRWRNRVGCRKARKLTRGYAADGNGCWDGDGRNRPAERSAALCQPAEVCQLFGRGDGAQRREVRRQGYAPGHISEVDRGNGAVDVEAVESKLSHAWVVGLVDPFGAHLVHLPARQARDTPGDEGALYLDCGDLVIRGEEDEINAMLSGAGEVPKNPPALTVEELFGDRFGDVPCHARDPAALCTGEAGWPRPPCPSEQVVGGGGSVQAFFDDVDVDAERGGLPQD